MIEITIPEKAHKTFSWLLNLGAEDRKKLVELIENAAPRLHIQNFAPEVEEAFEIEAKERRHLFIFLGALYPIKEAEEHTSSSLAKVVLSALERDDKLNTQIGDSEALCEFLEQLLSQDKTLGLSQKSLRVHLSRERHVLGTEILSGMQPIFAGTGEDVSPEAFTISHRIHFVFNDGESEENAHEFITMSSADLEELKKHIDRALAKEAALVRKLEREDFKFLASE